MPADNNPETVKFKAVDTETGEIVEIEMPADAYAEMVKAEEDAKARLEEAIEEHRDARRYVHDQDD